MQTISNQELRWVRLLAVPCWDPAKLLNQWPQAAFDALQNHMCLSSLKHWMASLCHQEAFVWCFFPCHHLLPSPSFQQCKTSSSFMFRDQNQQTRKWGERLMGYIHSQQHWLVELCRSQGHCWRSGLGSWTPPEQRGSRICTRLCLLGFPLLGSLRLFLAQHEGT